MTIKRLQKSARMSQAVIHGGLVYLAGQVGTEGAGIKEQTHQALAGTTTTTATVAGAAPEPTTTPPPAPETTR